MIVFSGMSVPFGSSRPWLQRPTEKRPSPLDEAQYEDNQQNDYQYGYHQA